MTTAVKRLPSTMLVALALGIALCASLLLSLIVGAMQIPFTQVLVSVFDYAFNTHYSTLSGFEEVVVLELRLPRILLAASVGAILAQCGAVMQGLFRNPLADPGIVGVSSGAAMGAVVAIALLPIGMASWTTPVLSFAFGLITTMLVYNLARTPQNTSVLMMLLAGIAISAFSGALIGFISYFSDDQALRALSLWQMGTLAGANSSNILLSLCTMLLLAYLFQRHAGALNAFLLGEQEARHLGIPVERLKLQLIVLTAIGVGVAVSSSGIIGFIGLVVPHIIRLTLGPNHSHLLPLSALCGAALLVTSDLLARTLAAPAELPVGVITALIGAPFFLVLLFQQRRQGIH